MVEKHPHSSDTASSQPDPTSQATTVKTPDANPIAGNPVAAKEDVAKQKTDAPEATADSVAARRAAHGLSPETTRTADAAEAKRREKEASAEDRKRKAQRKHKMVVARRAIIAIVILIFIGIIVGFWLLRWGLHDDTQSIQGKWRVQGTDTIIQITDEEILLTDEVAYDYVLDPEAKTLTFKFGALTGDGRYRFSLDHSMLSIDDGEFDAMGTLMADIPWTFDAITRKLLSNQEKNPGLETSDMVLERVE